MSDKKSDLETLLENGVDIRNRTIYLQGEIGEPLTFKFIRQIRYLDQTTGNILVILDSEGGDVMGGFAIYDEIRACQNDITIRVVGSAMSMGSVILQAGDKRIMTKVVDEATLFNVTI